MTLALDRAPDPNQPGAVRTRMAFPIELPPDLLAYLYGIASKNLQCLGKLAAEGTAVHRLR